MNRVPTHTRLLLVLTAVVLSVFQMPLLMSDVAAAGLTDEARRQLRFAEAELSRGEFDRALKSAESALRLDPALYESFVLKALAYEGLGNAPLAESLLIAYQELTKGLDADPRVEAALTRIRSAAAPSRRGPSPVPAGGKDPTAVTATRVDGAGSEAVASLDPGPYRERVVAALDDGKCAAAKAAASEFALAQPNLPDGYRFLGDAARCAGDFRAAVLAYRRYKDLGGTENSVDLMLTGLVANLGSLIARVTLPSGDVLPHASVHLPDETVAGEPMGGGEFVFDDLPTGQTLVVSVTGKGLGPADIEVEALAAGERREVFIDVEFIGLATVEVVEHPPGVCATTLLTPDGDVAAGPGSSSEVTAAEVVALVTGDYGEVEIPIDVAAGAIVQFDPTPWIPTSITVVGVPGGSTVRVFVEGMGGAMVEREIYVPVAPGTLDVETGVMVAPPQRLVSLVGGVGGIFLEHPVLGEGTAAVVLEPGAANATTFKWDELPGVEQVQGRYARWSEQRTAIRRKAGVGAGIFAGVAAGSGILSGILWGLAADAGVQADGSKSLALTAAGADVPDLAEIEGHRAAYDAAAARRTGAIVGGSITAGLAGAGLAISITFGDGSARKGLAELGPWDPGSLDGE